MKQFDRSILGKKIKTLREAVGISQHDFSSMIDISKRSLASIELGATNISVALLSVISSFYNLTIEKLTDENLNVPDNFREKIISLHKDNTAYQIILNKRPNLTYAISYKLLKENFLNNPKEINEIRSFFEKNGWNYLGTSISNALKRMHNLIKIEPHPTKKGTFVYSKR